MTRDQLLKAVSTRELLAAKGGNAFATGYAFLRRMTKGGVMLEYKYDTDEIKAELALRPHVPNKNESRGLRMQRKKNGVQRSRKAV